MVSGTVALHVAATVAVSKSVVFPLFLSVAALSAPGAALMTMHMWPRHAFNVAQLLIKASLCMGNSEEQSCKRTLDISCCRRGVV